MVQRLFVTEHPPSEAPRSRSDDAVVNAQESFANQSAQERIEAYQDEFEVIECFQSLTDKEAIAIVEVLDNHYAEDMNEKIAEKTAEAHYHRIMDPEDYPGAER